MEEYTNSDYVVFAKEEFFVWPGTENETVAHMIRECEAEGAALLTAYDPEGEPTDPEENELAQAALREDLEEALDGDDGVILPAESRDPTEQFEPEPCWFVVGIDQETADYLADKYKQPAYIWIDEDGHVSVCEVA